MRSAGLGTAATVIVVGLSGGLKVALCERCCATKLGRMGGGAEGMGGGEKERGQGQVWVLLSTSCPGLVKKVARGL